MQGRVPEGEFRKRIHMRRDFDCSKNSINKIETLSGKTFKSNDTLKAENWTIDGTPVTGEQGITGS